MQAVDTRPDLDLQLIVGASALLERFGRAVNTMRKDGFEPDVELPMLVEGESLVTQAKSTGLGIIELATAIDRLDPDMVVTVADRFETMATAVAATYLNKPLVHIQGGEISGNIDDRVRHAITKLADLHFPSTEESKERVIRMGEDPERVFNFGCPAMDLLVGDLRFTNQDAAMHGVGEPIDWEKPYVLMVQHPVTTSFGRGRSEVTETLEALRRIDIQKVVVWPNADAGSDDVSKGIRMFRESHPNLPFRYVKDFDPEIYARVLAGAACCVGNSSSFIREGSFLGVPAVIVGDRQTGRESGSNVVTAAYDRDEITPLVLQQIDKGRHDRDSLFGAGDAGVRIAEKLATYRFRGSKRSWF